MMFEKHTTFLFLSIGVIFLATETRGFALKDIKKFQSSSLLQKKADSDELSENCSIFRNEVKSLVDGIHQARKDSWPKVSFHESEKCTICKIVFTLVQAVINKEGI